MTVASNCYQLLIWLKWWGSDSPSANNLGQRLAHDISSFTASVTLNSEFLKPKNSILNLFQSPHIYH